MTRDNLSAQAEAYFSDGTAARQNGELGKAQAHFEKAVASFAALSDRSGEANALTNLGAVYADSKQYFRAIETLQRAIQLHESLGNRNAVALTMFSLAATVFDSGQLFRSRPFLDDAEKLLAAATGNDELLDAVRGAKTQLDMQLPAGLTPDAQRAWDAASVQMKSAAHLAMVAYGVGNLAQAIQHWRVASQAAQELERDHEYSAFLVYIGAALCQQGHYDDGIAAFTQAGLRAHAASSGAVEASALNGLGCAYLDLGQPERAIGYLRQAVDAGAQSDARPNVAEALGNLGMAYARVSDIEAAITTLARASDVYRSLGHLEMVAVIEERIPKIQNGAKYTTDYVFGDPTRSLTIEKPEDLSTHIAAAREHEQRGDYSRALTIYRRLLDTAREVEDRGLQAFLLIAIGFASRRAGHLTESLTSYHQALSAAREAKDGELEARALNNIGVLYSTIDHDAALNFLRAAAIVREGLPDQHELGETYLSLGQLMTGHDAVEYLRKAIALLSPERGLYVWASAYAALKRLLEGDERDEFLRTYRDTALQYGADFGPFGTSIDANFEFLHEIVPLNEENEVGLLVQTPKGLQRAPDVEWQLRVVRAESLWITNRHADAIQQMFAAIDDIELHRVTITDSQQRQKYFGAQWSVYDTLLSYLVTEGRLEEALEVVERAKARTIVEIAGEIDGVLPSAPAEFKSAYRGAHRELRRATEEVADLEKQAWAGESGALYAARRNLAHAYATINRLNEEMASYKADREADCATMTYARMQRLLRAPEHAFIAYWLGDTTTGAFLLSRQGVEFFPLDALMADSSLSRMAATLDALPRERSRLAEALADLYECLFQPLEPSIAAMGISEITFVPHNYAHLVPFHALSSEQGYLSDLYQSDYVPSLALYALCYDRGSNSADDALLIGNPDGSLAFATIEVEQIRTVLPNAALITGADAHLGNILPATGRARIIHFACHGEFGPDQGRDIALRLAPTINHNGLLTLRQVMTTVNVAT